MQTLIVHTASLFYCFEPYTAHLDDRIHAALDAGLDGVELSNGRALLNWVPHAETVRRLYNHIVTIHAELGPTFGLTLYEWQHGIAQLKLPIAHATFHPDQLTRDELNSLHRLPFPVSLENMDSSHDDWRTADEIRRVWGGSITFDTAHAEQHGLTADDFRGIPVREVHLSITNRDYYLGLTTQHAQTRFAPTRFPRLPDCDLICLEGLVPPGDPDGLRAEVEYVRERLGKGATHR